MNDEIRPVKLWVDDVRRPPTDEWTWAKTVEEAIEILAGGGIVEASLDHDLHPFRRDGFEVCEWMRDNDVWPSILHIHSSNRVGSGRMCSLIQRSGYKRYPGRPRSFHRGSEDAAQ